MLTAVRAWLLDVLEAAGEAGCDTTDDTTDIEGQNA